MARKERKRKVLEDRGFLDRMTGFAKIFYLVSFVFLANFAPKASFVAKLCHRPQGHQDGLILKLTNKILTWLRHIGLTGIFLDGHKIYDAV